MVANRLLQWGFEGVRRQVVRKGARSMVVDVAGERFHYYDVPGRGDGPPVVLVHGLAGSATGWARCLFELARGSRRVVAVDLPGSGFSPVPPSGPMGLEALMRSFAAFVEQEVREPAVFVGNSLGGAMVARYAAHHPEHVAAAVLVAPAGARLSPERLHELVRGLTITTAADARALVRRIFHRPPLVGGYLFAAGLRTLYATAGVTRILNEALESGALTVDELQGLKPPVLLLWGGSEKVLPYEGIDYFRAHLPGTAEIREVRGFGHSPQVERPRKLCKLIEDFVERRVPRRAQVAQPRAS